MSGTVIVTKTITTEAISLTIILHRISLLLRVYYRITYTLFDYIMNLNGFTLGMHMNVWLSKLFTVKF